MRALSCCATYPLNLPSTVLLVRARNSVVGTGPQQWYCFGRQVSSAGLTTRTVTPTNKEDRGTLHTCPTHW
jgi:hypothetical protein